MPGFHGAVSQQDHGQPHQRARRPAFKALPDYFPCCRCGKPVSKWETETLRDGRTRSAVHYDHDEHGGYLGFSHMECNRGAGAAKGGRIAHAIRRTNKHARTRGVGVPRHGTPWRSRVW